MQSYTFLVPKNVEEKINRRDLGNSKRWRQIVEEYKKTFGVTEADYNYIVGKHNVVFASVVQEGTVGITHWKDMRVSLEVTPLFSTFAGNNIQLLARDEKYQYMITLSDIEYWFYFAIPPMCEKDTELRKEFDAKIIKRFIRDAYPHLEIVEESIIDAESFQFDQP